MNKFFLYGIAASAMFASVACSSDPTPNQTSSQQTTEPGAVTNPANGTGQLQQSHNEDTVTWNKVLYTYHIDRTPDTTKTVALDDSDKKFSDNKITLVIKRGTAEFVRKTFTKDDFASHLDTDFRQKGILEGLVYDQIAPNGLQFAASVCYPQSDLYIPLLITVSSSGKISIRKDDTLDTSNPETEEEQ